MKWFYWKAKSKYGIIIDIKESEEQNHVSTKTQIAGFEFDNCLMNAAGVVWWHWGVEGVKNSAAGTFVTKQQPWNFREIRNHVIKMFQYGSINSMGLPNNVLDYYLNYLLELQEKEANRTFFLSLVEIFQRNSYHLKRFKKVIFEVNWTQSHVQMFLVNLKLPMTLKLQIVFLSEVFGFYQTLRIKLPPILILCILTRLQELSNIRQVVNCVNSSEMVFI